MRGTYSLGVRRCAVVLLGLLAGCGSNGGSGGEHSASTPVPPTNTVATVPSNVFTVPDELPPRESSEEPAEARHNPDTAPPGGDHEPEPARKQSRGAPTDAEIQRELAEALGVTGSSDVIDQAGLTEAGLATVPPSAPAKVAAIITAANQVAHAPYRYGGGHGGVGGDETWVDTAYDCSGSISFALASAGLVESQLTSGLFMKWGKPGPGKWVTIFANEGHAFMVVAGLRFDTVERARTGTRWGRAYSQVSGFVARHPPGL
jgi:cell wall-associated NlpC family hydrolase